MKQKGMKGITISRNCERARSDEFDVTTHSGIADHLSLTIAVEIGNLYRAIERRNVGLIEQYEVVEVEENDLLMTEAE